MFRLQLAAGADDELVHMLVHSAVVKHKGHDCVEGDAGAVTGFQLTRLRKVAFLHNVLNCRAGP